MPELRVVESNNETRDLLVIEVSDRVPGERARIVISGRNTEDDRPCTVIVIHEESGTWVIHGLGNQGVRVPSTDMRALAEAILKRVR
ncbi:MAG TPA: hypothetical protein VF003_00840 [Pseudonocardiaceae bacterium]